MNEEQKGVVTAPAPIKGLDEEKYRGQWLVIDGNTGRIVVVGSQLEEVQKKAKGKTVEQPVYYKVPASDTHHVVIK